MKIKENLIKGLAVLKYLIEFSCFMRGRITKKKLTWVLLSCVAKTSILYVAVFFLSKKEEFSSLSDGHFQLWMFIFYPKVFTHNLWESQATPQELSLLLPER